MAQETVFEGIIVFLEKIGIFRVVLPFILVFTIVFALLERTRILGVEKVKVGGEKVEVTKKNLNAMVAFVSGFFVIASSKLVSLIDQTIGKVVLVVIVFVLFLMLAGSFHEESKEAFFIKEGIWRTLLMTIAFLSILFIFLHELPGPGKEPSFLEWFFEYLSRHWDTNWVGSIILITLVILFMWWITKTPSASNDKDNKKPGDDK